MALQLPIYNPYSGNECDSYCVIDIADYNKKNGYIVVQIDCYVSQDIRERAKTDSNTKPFCSEQYSYPILEFRNYLNTEDSEPISAAAYRIVKIPVPGVTIDGNTIETNKWVNATDC